MFVVVFGALFVGIAISAGLAGLMFVDVAFCQHPVASGSEKRIAATSSTAGDESLPRAGHDRSSSQRGKTQTKCDSPGVSDTVGRSRLRRRRAPSASR